MSSDTGDRIDQRCTCADGAGGKATCVRHGRFMNVPRRAAQVPPPVEDPILVAKAALVPALTVKCLRLEVENRGLRIALECLAGALRRHSLDASDALAAADEISEGFAGEAGKEEQVPR